MKIVVGVASDETVQSSLAQVAALGFLQPEIHLVHCINMYSYATVDTVGFGGFDWSAQIAYSLEAESQRLLEEAADQARKLGFTAVKTTLLRGDAGGEIMTYADAAEADLIAVCAAAARPAEAFIGGSVARKLAIAARQSVLISRPENSRPWSGEAVFATDLSKYSQSCAELLKGWSPKGLTRLRVLTAYKLGESEAMRKLGKDLAPRSDQSFSSALEQANKEFATSFESMGTGVESTIFAGDVHTAINQEMAGPKPADLLILGSQGKGFFARLRLGSTSLRQVETGNYSALVLRPH